MFRVARIGCLVGALCLCWCGVLNADAEVDSVPHRTSNDIYMNPCKARGFMGDVALSDDDIMSTHRGRLPQTYGRRQHIRHRVRRSWSQWKRERLNFGVVKGREKEMHHSRRRRAATSNKSRLWDNGIIPFEIADNFTVAQKALLHLAMKNWEKHTCIVFRNREPTDKNYFTFTKQSCGCCSFVGKKREPQSISIGKTCDKFGVVLHELGHVIGFWHEHTRPDRDYYVHIYGSNIEEGQEFNFKKIGEIDSLGEAYDYSSIMHYARNTFAKQSYQDTIIPRRRSGTIVRPAIGQRVELSDSDIRQANKLYSCPSCGGTLQDSSAEFTHTPTLGKPELCQWRISATHGEKIVLNVSMLSIPKSRNCETDYLEIRDGHYLKSPLIGRYCGNDLPDTMESTDARMWIEFKSRFGRGKGFTAGYEAMCGGQISKGEGFLTSPNYPDEYQPAKKCVWKILVPEGFTVALKFQYMEIEKHDKCSYDYLEVRDGPDESSPIIGNLCGYKIPEDLQSSGKDMHVTFSSDRNVQKLGFFATFIKEIDECATKDHGCYHNCENTLGSYKCSCNVGYELHADGKRCQVACGGILDQENGTITSPSYPDLYPANKNCIWQIVAPENHKIHINFSHFDVEGANQECEYDSVRVGSVIGTHIKFHGVFCGGSLPPPVTSKDNKLRINFNSDNSVQKTGFKAIFQTDKDECSVDNGGCQHLCKNTVGSYHCACHNGYNLHDDGHGCKEGQCRTDISTNQGTVLSANFPERYPSRQDCVWHFTTVPGHRVRLTFETFSLEPHPDCVYDHLAIYDGGDRSARRLGKFCGASVPQPVFSTGNELFMYFFSDVSVERKGFEIKHDSVCGGDLFVTATIQSFVSHARYGDFNYGSGSDCEWKIRGKAGHRVTLAFTEFNLEDEKDCKYDAVHVYDVVNDTSRPIGIYCGNQIPESFTSSSESLLVRFRTDDTVSLKGFSASYQLTTHTL